MRDKANWGPWIFSAIGLVVLLTIWQPPAHGEDPSTAEGRLELTRQDRMKVQRELTERGFAVGPIDGIFGRRTRAAIRDWQRTTGLEVTGYVAETGLGKHIAREAPVGEANRARFRTSDYATRVEAAERLKSSRRRSTALLAIVFEQTAAGELKAARSTAHKIEDARKRDRALERIREAEARAAWKLNGLQAIPPKGEFTTGGP